ncbi:glycosyltransferase family 9 protein [Thermodesulfomicrobium sp. WS]|uniref:glycosyltransferase family 9 protein n=1 Tax=Thermodesulfomicrobium sp. WS TaxID=3004129 RepID=UPI00248FBB4B|nr:glycosyltransferase family 9 protein [Thermodesulfomicrobium sp. WS]
MKLLIQLLKKCRKRLFTGLDKVASSLACSRPKSGVALIRLDAIGDFIICLDSAKEFRRIYPEQRITLIANAAWAEMAQVLPYWDEVWPVDVKAFVWNLFYRFFLIHKVSKANFEIAIQPTFSRVFLIGDSIVRVSRANHRIGSIGDLSNIDVQDKRISDRWYTRLLPANKEPLMELDRNAEFIRHLSGRAFSASLPRWNYQAVLRSELQPRKPYFILFPGASWKGRMWPTRHFVQVAQSLCVQFGWQVVLCGAKNEWTVCQNILDGISGWGLNLAGRTNLIELADLIRDARLLIANETSAVHIAAAVSTPAVCILGGGHYGRFMPYPEQLDGIKPVVAARLMSCFGCNWRCTQPHDAGGPVPCISAVSVEQVLDCARKALDMATCVPAH